MKVLFLVPYPTEGASNRVRVEQFIPYLASKGVISRVRPFINRPFYRILFKKGAYLAKSCWFLICTANRAIDLVRALRYDIIFIHREAYPFGGPFIERILYLLGKKIVFDFDDAIFLPNTSKENIYIDRLKSPKKTAKIIEMSRLVIAGNSYLKDFASRHNNNVMIIPSSLDTDKYRPIVRNCPREVVIIGWIGSVTTQEFLLDIEDALAEVSRRHKNVRFKVIGGEFRSSTTASVENKKWSLQDEVADIQSFDIGIMPVPANEWARGKCGFKVILYMACGLPVVISAVGANTEIVDDGINGFLVTTREEWVEKLSILVNDAALRATMGMNGRKKVVERYSLGHAAPFLYNGLVAVDQKRNGR